MAVAPRKLQLRPRRAERTARGGASHASVQYRWRKRFERKLMEAPGWSFRERTRPGPMQFRDVAAAVAARVSMQSFRQVPVINVQ